VIWGACTTEFEISEKFWEEAHLVISIDVELDLSKSKRQYKRRWDKVRTRLFACKSLQGCEIRLRVFSIEERAYRYLDFDQHCKCMCLCEGGGGGKLESEES